MKNILFVIGLAFSCTLFSQQDPHYTQYMYNMNVVNPAYAGIHEGVNFRAFSRQQWAGIKGAPTTHTFTVQSPLGNKNLGGALSFVSDNIGPVNEINVFGDISYSIETSSKNKLAFGIKAGYTSLNRDVSGLLTNNPEQYSDFPQTYGAFNLGVGAFYYAKRYYLGVSFPYLFNNRFIENKTNPRVGEGQNYYINGGYVHELANGIKIKPSFMYRGIDDSFESLDVSFNVFFKNGFEVGTSYRISNSASLMANYKFGKNSPLTIGYAYEHNFSELSEFSNGSHEIMLMYDLNKRSKDKFGWRPECY